MTTQPCEDDGLESETGIPTIDEPMDPDPRQADYDTPLPADFEEWDETPPEGGAFPGEPGWYDRGGSLPSGYSGSGPTEDEAS